MAKFSISLFLQMFMTYIRFLVAQYLSVRLKNIGARKKKRELINFTLLEDLDITGLSGPIYNCNIQVSCTKTTIHLIKLLCVQKWRLGRETMQNNSSLRCRPDASLSIQPSYY